MAGRGTGRITELGTFMGGGLWRLRCWLILPLSVLLVSSPTVPRSKASTHGPSKALFETSDRCVACHNGLSTSTGEDVSIGVNWRASMMANSSRDPYWQAAVRRETMDHPKAAAAIEDECAVCHMPMSRYEAMVDDREGEVFSFLPFDSDDPSARLAADGVSCTACHQIEDEGLGSKESFVGRFKINENRAEGDRKIYGPFEIDAGLTRIMRSSAGFQPTEGKHIQESELCATCHTLYTKALGPEGEVVGELPEQTPYLEWLHLNYAQIRRSRRRWSCGGSGSRVNTVI